MGTDEEEAVLTGRSGSLRDHPKEFIESRKDVDAIAVAQIPLVNLQPSTDAIGIYANT